MLGRCLLTLAVCGVIAPFAFAETYGEKVKAVDADKKTLTIAVDGKDKVLAVDANAEVATQVRVGKRLRVTPVKEGLKGVKTGVDATITTEKRDGKEVVTKIVLLVPDPKGK